MENIHLIFDICAYLAIGYFLTSGLIGIVKTKKAVKERSSDEVTNTSEFDGDTLTDGFETISDKIDSLGKHNWTIPKDLPEELTVVGGGESEGLVDIAKAKISSHRCKPAGNKTPIHLSVEVTNTPEVDGDALIGALGKRNWAIPKEQSEILNEALVIIGAGGSGGEGDKFYDKYQHIKVGYPVKFSCSNCQGEKKTGIVKDKNNSIIPKVNILCDECHNLCSYDCEEVGLMMSGDRDCLSYQSIFDAIEPDKDKARQMQEEADEALQAREMEEHQVCCSECSSHDVRPTYDLRHEETITSFSKCSDCGATQVHERKMKCSGCDSSNISIVKETDWIVRTEIYATCNDCNDLSRYKLVMPLRA